MNLFVKILIPFFIYNFSFAGDPAFRLHLFNEPTHTDPQLQQSASSNYLAQNLYRNIYKIDEHNKLVFDLGDSCRWQNNLRLACRLKKNLKWSDGSPLTVNDFINTYRKLLDPKSLANNADLLFKIKNAKDIYLGKTTSDKLGIKTNQKNNEIIYEFSEIDLDFEYSLAHIALAPWKNEKLFSGPYQIADWQRAKKIILKNNPYYHINSKRPDVEFYFISEDNSALQLYEKNQLDFLRRLPSLYIPKYKDKPEFQWLQVLRFDYFGFGPQLKEQASLRKAISLGLNYAELQKIFSAEGRPGCVGLPTMWSNNHEICHEFKLAEAKKINLKDSAKTLELHFSQLGGDDHHRAAEWIQSQLKQNLGIDLQIKSLENKLFIDELKKQTPFMFRKGLALERPTCLAALENFSSDNAENYIQLNDSEYEKILNKLRSAKSVSEKNKYCEQGLRLLVDKSYIIPTGPIHFAILAKAQFKGWKLNQLNQLDLSHLEFVSK